jgi:hypothetical protein
MRLKYPVEWKKKLSLRLDNMILKDEIEKKILILKKKRQRKKYE